MSHTTSAVSPTIKFALDRNRRFEKNERMTAVNNNLNKESVAFSSPKLSSAIKQEDCGNSFNQVIPSGWLFKFLQLL